LSITKKTLIFAKKIIAMKAEKIKQDFSRISPFLDEKSTRLYVANLALSIGRGGKTLVSKSLGVSRVRINNGIQELLGQKPLSIDDKKRRKGGGRKPIEHHQPGINEQIESIISPYTRGDPMNPLKWCSKSLRNIAKAMKAKGYSISHVSIEKYLQNNKQTRVHRRKTAMNNLNISMQRQSGLCRKKNRLSL
jgi:hypothetical protein